MPAYLPSLNTQMYLNPNLTKHSYTKSIGDLISKATGAYAVKRQHEINKAPGLDGRGGKERKTE